MPDITQMQFMVQPSDTEASTTILPEVQVALQDETGEVVISATNPVTVAIEDNPGGGVLSGTLIRNAVAGIATFNDLNINQPGVDYTLRASVNLSDGIDPSTFSNCTEWVSADQPSLSEFEEDDPIGLDPDNVWLDRITAVRHWRRPEEELCPLLKLSGGPNGKPYLDFTGDPNKHLSWSNSASTLLSFAGYTGFIVCQPRLNGIAGRDRILFSSTYVGISLVNTGSGNRFQHWVNSGGGSESGTDSTTVFTLDDWYIVEFWFDGTRIYIKINGDAETSIIKAPASLAQNPAIMHGGTGFLTERLTFNADIGAVARAAFRESLAIDHGIALP